LDLVVVIASKCLSAFSYLIAALVMHHWALIALEIVR